LRDQPDLRDIPAPFDQVISKCLAKEPQDRYQSADELMAIVMEADGISASVDSFDAASLSQTPRAPAAHDPDRTVTSPAGAVPPPPPPMDVRGDAQELPERLQRKLDRFSRKLEQKAGKLEKRLGKAGFETLRRHGGKPRHPRAPRESRKRGIGHLLILGAVTFGIAVVLNLIYGRSHSDPPAGVPIFLAILGGTVGPLLTYFRFVQREYVESDLLNRLAYASVAGLFMIPAYLIASEEMNDPHLAKVILGPLAAMVICDWTRRIEEGRRGQVKGGAAFWPALVGLIAAPLSGAEDAALVCAGVCAAISLMTQSAAGLWPMRRAGKAEPDILGAHHSPLAKDIAEGVAAAQAVAAATEQITPSTPLPQVPRQSAGTHDESNGAAPPATPSRTSFVGRTAHAGISFVGTTLFLLGLLLALGQGAFREQARAAIANETLDVDKDLAVVIEHGIPPGITLSLLFVGCLMLIAARRRDGLAHFLRGCLGCLFTLWGAIVATFWGAPVLHALFSSAEGFNLDGAGPWTALIMMLSTFGVGAILLLWPRPVSNGRPIVI
jgi:hypothetical protein